jgi:hypothetical protein
MKLKELLGMYYDTLLVAYVGRGIPLCSKYVFLLCVRLIIIKN